MDASPTNVVAIRPKEAMATRLRALFSRCDKATEDWISASLELIQTLKEARNLFPSNQTFGVWLAEEELDVLSRDDRAALLNMAHDLDLARMAFQESGRRSYRLIWREWMEPRLRSAAKMESVV